MRFNIGDKVLHKNYPKRLGTIMKIVNEEEPRYYVRLMGWMWSVPESSLFMAHQQTRIEQYSEDNKQNNVFMSKGSISEDHS